MVTKNSARDVKSVVKANPGRYSRRSMNGAEPTPIRQEAATMLPPKPEATEEDSAETIRKPGESDIQAIKRHRRNELEKLTSFQSPLEEAKYIMDRIAALDFKKARLLEMCSDSAFDIVKRYI